MKTIFLIFSLSVILPGINSVQADEKEIKAALSGLMPSLKIDSIVPSAAKGLYEVTLGSSILYVSDDGKYMLEGHLIDIEARQDLTELKLATARKHAIEKLGEDKMIIFKSEKNKYKVSIFTDIDCGYCRKLHSEMDQYLAEGITVQYLFFPRAGKGSDSYNKAVSVWCAKDKNAALTDAKNGKSLETKNCENPIDEHMQLGAEFEVRGTPMILTEKGKVFPGYVPARRLASALAIE